MLGVSLYLKGSFTLGVSVCFKGSPMLGVSVSEGFIYIGCVCVF